MTLRRTAAALAFAVLGLWAGGTPAAGPAPDLADGRYPYLAPSGEENPLVARWVALARAMPDWKDKAKAAHYRFPPGKDGRKCDQADCHPGFRDDFVEKLLALPDGPDRQGAREPRQGLERCGDCHGWDRIRRRTAACRLHFRETDRVECTSCHLEGPKVLEPRGEKKTAVVRDLRPARAWPAHELTKDEKAIACDRSCHAPQNPFGVERVCTDCHGEGKLEVPRLAAAGVLVHATDPRSPWPRLTDRFFVGLTVVVTAALLAHILLDIVRSRKEEDR
ncbi:hypothetical protein [Deferrisoma sp.]